MADIKSVCEAGDVLASPTAGDVECSIEQEGTRAFQQRVSSYDSYGRLQNLVLQEGYTYSAFAYDGEDEPTQYQTSNGWCNNDGTFAVCPTSTNAFTYSARGELLQTSMNGTTTTRQSADGFMCTPSSGGCQESFDSRSDMLLSAKGFTYSYNGYGWQTSVKNGGTVTRSYDADGHLTLQQNASSATLPCTSYQYGCDPGANVVDVGTQGEYSWGPTGRIANYVDDHLGARYTNGPPSFSEHWDELTGDLLFENVSTGGAIQGNQQSNFNIGRLGVSNASNGVTVEDRDPFGQIAATHDSYGFAAWTALRPTQPLKLGQPYSSAQGSNYPSTDPQSASRILDASRPDAYIDQTYGVSFQGVRAADANTTQWLTPDPFDGYAGDPMSQQPYAWNNNNAVLYSEPSGYSSTFDETLNPPAGGGCTGSTSTGQIACSPDCTGWWVGNELNDACGGSGSPLFGDGSPGDGLISSPVMVGAWSYGQPPGDPNLLIHGAHSDGKFTMVCRGFGTTPTIGLLV